MSDWYYAADNEQKGPISDSELKAQLASNKIPGETLVWTDGMDNWTPANEVAALKEPSNVQAGTATTPASTVVSTPGANNPDSTKPVDLASMLGKPESLEVTAEDADQNRVFGILAYLGIFVLVPIIVAKDSPFAKYHSNQGLVLFLAELAVFFVTGAFVFIPFLGILVYFLHLIFLLVFVVMAILGIINAAQGKCVPLPVIGGIKLIK
ncbi:MAG TPA: GYF domain-containing protein [Candidatus Methylacidiphilales bacterium]|jgi:uncharacterized membrane protein|nr:GYF domain-containing protein [Candidatus Methylacidiphilales bacterium]